MKMVRITSNYCYLDNNIVEMWYILGLPFTFEELPEAIQKLEEVKLDADTGRRYTMQELYKISDYLISELCHPILFDLSDWVENYAECPD
jgi:hypothetical protein